MVVMVVTLLVNGHHFGRESLLQKNRHNPSYFFSTNLLFSSSGQTLGWTGLIRVDGTAYGWMGDPADVSFVNQTSYTYTSTSSIYVQSVEDKVQIKITFLSPITPDDFLRQSLIFSYVDVEVVSLDGSEHDVQLYTDISAGMWNDLSSSNIQS